MIVNEIYGLMDLGAVKSKAKAKTKTPQQLAAEAKVTAFLKKTATSVVKPKPSTITMKPVLISKPVKPAPVLNVSVKPETTEAEMENKVNDLLRLGYVIINLKMTQMKFMTDKTYLDKEYAGLITFKNVSEPMTKSGAWLIVMGKPRTAGDAGPLPPQQPTETPESPPIFATPEAQAQAESQGVLPADFATAVAKSEATNPPEMEVPPDELTFDQKAATMASFGIKPISDFKAKWTSLPQKEKILIAGGAIGAVALIGFLVYRSRQQPETIPPGGVR